MKKKSGVFSGSLLIRGKIYWCSPICVQYESTEEKWIKIDVKNIKNRELWLYTYVIALIVNNMRNYYCNFRKVMHNCYYC